MKTEFILKEKKNKQTEQNRGKLMIRNDLIWVNTNENNRKIGFGAFFRFTLM